MPRDLRVNMSRNSVHHPYLVRHHAIAQRKREENETTISCRITKSDTVRQELYNEYTQGKCDRYKIVCHDGEVMVSTPFF